MQSKFWAGGDLSESESDSVESVVVAPTETRRPPVAPRHAFEMSSSDDDDTNRVVRSFQDRQWDSMRETVRQVENHMKNGDFVELGKDYEALLKLNSKTTQFADPKNPPAFFIKCIGTIEAYVDDKLKNREAFKKYSKSKALALNTLKAKMKKFNDIWQEALEQFRSNPEMFDEADRKDDEDQDGDDQDDSDYEGDESSDYDGKGDDEDSDDESSVDGSGSEASSDSGDRWGEDNTYATTAEGKGKYSNVMDVWGAKAKDEKNRKKPAKSRQKQTSKHRKGAREAERGETLIAKDIEGLLDMDDISADAILKRVQRVVERRGRRGVDRVEQANILRKLADLARTQGDQCYVKVVAQVVTAQFDTASGVNSCQSPEVWLETYKSLGEILEALERDSNVHLTDLLVQEPGEELSERETLRRSALILTGFMERLDDELTKSLQFKDVHSDVYKLRLGHTVDMLALLCRAYDFTLKHCIYERAAGLALRILDHIYCKQYNLAIRTWDLVKKRLPSGSLSFLGAESDEKGGVQPAQIIEYFVQMISKYGHTREKVDAHLQLAYNKAMHDFYYEARDLLQIPNMHEIALLCDVSTQILYNRALVQLGLCAFRKGLINEAHSCLAEICSQNRHKELLAQALSVLKNQEKTPEQELTERRRLLPYHVHINLDLVEGVHNICAMLLEVPHRAKHQDMPEYPISRQFSRILEIYDAQPFQGPPENQRETIVAATKALQTGNWKTCCQYIFALNIWDKFTNPEEVKEILSNRIKLEALQTYIFAFLNLYDSFSVFQLASMFALSSSEVHSIVSKMMVNEEIHASWDEKSENILINRVEPTRLQQLALALTRSISIAVEQNELTLNMKNPKFVLMHERRSPFQMHGDRQHGWNYHRGNYGDGVGTYGRGNRGQRGGGSGGGYRPSKRQTGGQTGNQGRSRVTYVRGQSTSVRDAPVQRWNANRNLRVSAGEIL